MTLSEKRVFFLGAGVGVAAVTLIGGVLGMRSGHVFASQPAPAGAPIQAQAESSAAREQQEGTQPGTTVQLTPAEMTAAGVQVAEVRTAVLKTNIDAFGRVEQPESQLAAVSAWIGGRVDKLYVQYTGERVRRGQRVAVLYSPEVATALEEYRLAEENRSGLSKSDDRYAQQQAEALVEASRRKLELWGIRPEQIGAPATGGGPAATGIPHVTIFANAEGTVVERKVTQGQYVSAGETLFTLADLSEIWLKVDVYEDQLPKIHPGQDVDITAEALPNRTLHGHVQFIEPTTNPQTRTVPVHVHLPNPGMRLMPGMFVSATFVSGAAESAVVAPRSAVLDAGTRKLVYVAEADGVFEAREVKVGAPTEDVFPVISGLKAGDRVVLNGNFMIDSQAQLSSGMTGLYGGSKEFASGQVGQTANGSNSAQSRTKIELRPGGELKGGEDNAFTARLTDAGGKAIPDAEVMVTVMMPAMPSMNMPEMRNSFVLAWSARQQMYAGKGKVPMAGSWTMTVAARKGGSVIASARSRLSAR